MTWVNRLWWFTRLGSVLVWGLVSGMAHAQFFDPLDGQLDLSDYLSENAYGFLPVPIVITDPAVDGGLGMMGLFFHETEEEKQKRMEAMRSADKNAGKYLLPPSVSVVAVAGTGNDSWFAGGGHMGFFKQGRIRYTAGGGYGDVNLDFFGTGEVELARPVEINTQALALIQVAKFKVKDSPWFLGVSQRYIEAQVSPNRFGTLEDVLPPAWIDELKRILTLDVTTSGLGAIAEFDTRDNIFTPKQGFQYQLEHLWYRDAIGSDIDYELTRFFGLNYVPLSSQWYLGVRIASEYADSDGLLPPFVTPALSLRGIPAMRYQGKFVAMAETELTWQVNPRWSVVGFGGVGRASNTTAEFDDAKSRSTVGTGFRYQIARRYGFDMGLDFAWGPEGMVWYITAGSAWGGI